MLEQWTRHERPDGHRSLWFKAEKWVTIEKGHGLCIRIGPKGDSGAYSDSGPVYTSSIGLGWVTPRWGCPVPTAADLAWLRGE